MAKLLLGFTALAGTALVIYGGLLLLDYMVTEKYHTQGNPKEQVIYTIQERAKEIIYLKRFFYYAIAVGILSIVSSLINIFSK